MWFHFECLFWVDTDCNFIGIIEQSDVVQEMCLEIWRSPQKYD